MAKKIALVNNKGGSSKTTTAVNIAGAYATKYPEKKILIAETAGPGTATRSFNLRAKSFEKSMYDVFMGNHKAEEVVVNALDNIDIIPANGDMNFVEFDLMATYEIANSRGVYSAIKELTPQQFNNMTMEDFEGYVDDKVSVKLTDNYFNMLEGKFDELDKEYDLIIFDTPPEIKAITSSVLSIADHVIIPYEPDTYSVEGVINMLGRIQSIQERYNSDLAIAGILAVKVQSRTLLHGEVRNRMMKYCMKSGINYFDSEIPNSIRFASSTSFNGLPATITMKDNTFVQSYYDLLEELVEKDIV